MTPPLNLPPFFPPGGADPRRGEGTFCLFVAEIFKHVAARANFPPSSSARRPAETAIAARAPAAIAAGPETDATAPNLQVTTAAAVKVSVRVQ